MNDSTFKIIELVVRLVVACLVVYIIPWVKKAITAWLADKEALKAVLSVQQTLWSSSSEERKSVAVSLVKSSLARWGIAITEDQIDELIEAAVHEMKIQKGDYLSQDEQDLSDGE